MSRLVKVFLVLAVVMPVTAYVIGTLVANGVDRPDERAPVVLLDAPTTDATSNAEKSKQPKPRKPNKSANADPDNSSSPPQGTNDNQGSNDDDDSRDDGSPAVDKNQPAVVATPKPTPVDDDGDDDDRDDDSRDDRSDDDDGTDD